MGSESSSAGWEIRRHNDLIDDSHDEVNGVA